MPKKTKERKHHHYLEKEKKYILMRFSFRGLFYEKIDEGRTLFKKEGIQQHKNNQQHTDFIYINSINFIIILILLVAEEGLEPTTFSL